jgi:hypothetical protein
MKVKPLCAGTCLLDNEDFSHNLVQTVYSFRILWNVLTLVMIFVPFLVYVRQPHQ